MKIELDLNAVTIGDDELLLLVLPLQSCPWTTEGDTDPLMEELKAAGFGDKVFIVYVDGAQMAKVKKA